MIIKGKDFTCADDVADIGALINKAAEIKNGTTPARPIGAGKNIGLLFFNQSLRTRISTQVAAGRLGMQSIVLNVGKDSWALEFADGAVMNGSTTEHIKDAGPVLSTYFDIIGVRAFPQLESAGHDYAEHVIGAFKKYCTVPVISLESATLHPLQSLADMLTIKEHMPATRRPKVTLMWAPHIKPLPQCVANSFAEWALKWGVPELTIAQPPGFELKEEFTQGARIVHTREEGLEAADFIYVKNWSSYSHYGHVAEGRGNWMLQEKDMQTTNNAYIMHCLPVRRNVELSDELLDGPRSLVGPAAENRVPAAQAVIGELLATR